MTDLFIYEPTDPETIPGQHVTISAGSDAPAVIAQQPSPLAARCERLERELRAYEVAFKHIRWLAQAGMLETTAARAAERLESIDVFAALVLLGVDVTSTPAERVKVDES